MNLLNFIPSPAGARKANERSGEIWLCLSDARQVSDLPMDFSYSAVFDRDSQTCLLASGNML
jgi:hypothetical protein